MCSDFSGSYSKSLASNRKFLGICLLGYKNLLNFIWYTKKFHNRNNTITQFAEVTLNKPAIYIEKHFDFVLQNRNINRMYLTCVRSNCGGSTCLPDFSWLLWLAYGSSRISSKLQFYSQLCWLLWWLLEKLWIGSFPRYLFLFNATKPEKAAFKY